GGEKRTGLGDERRAAGVLPGPREDRRALAAEQLLVGVPRERQRLGHSRFASMMRSRNCCVRGSRGAVKICSGGPSSMIVPPSRKHTRLAMSRANDISCVAMIIVMPPA